MRLAMATLMARVKAFFKDEELSAFAGARVRFAGTRAAQPLNCASVVHPRRAGAIASLERMRPFRPLLKRERSGLAKLWVVLTQLAALIVLMSLFVALLSVGS